MAVVGGVDSESCGADELQSKISILRKRIATLKSREAAQMYNKLTGATKPHIPESYFLQKEAEDESSEMTGEDLKESVRLGRIFAGLKFGKLEKWYLDKHTYKMSGEGIGGCVKFHIDVTINEEEELEIRTLNLSFEDVFHKKELTPWKNKCVREKALWKFGCGLRSYTPLFNRRAKIITWLSKDYTKYFDISEEIDVCGYIIRAFSGNKSVRLFKAIWKIEWLDVHDSDDLTFRMHDDISFAISKKVHGLTTVCKRLCDEPDISDEDIKEFWMEVTDFIDKLDKSTDN